jgi:hypothetical protein
MKGMDMYAVPRTTSAVTMSRRRSNRSTRTPANGPKKIEGRSRAIITPATAKAGFLSLRVTTRDVTARNPTQSPSDETSMARHRREKEP